ncbi:hypothetical protein HT031_001840 [Scenedesmus sp. PABB004]|nr:hypothetical protein HT031_001840 [Scenedesmus sp. PABB004]
MLATTMHATTRAAHAARASRAAPPRRVAASAPHGRASAARPRWAPRAAAPDGDAEPVDAAPEPVAAIDGLAADAADAVSGAADAAAAAVDRAAAAASAAVSDASDVATAAVGDAAAAAAALQGTVAASVSGAAPGIDWGAAAAGGAGDPRFVGLNVLVTGATGGVGRRVVEALRAKGVPTRALVRDAARAAKLLPAPTPAAGAEGGPPAFEVAVGDVYQYASLPPAFKGVNAVVVASAANNKADPFGPFNTDFQGTLNLIAAARRAGVKRFVFVTSIGADDPLNPLNLFFGILFWKKRAEEELQRSGLPAVIVRPGGLRDSLPPGEEPGAIVMEGPGAFGFPPRRSGSILRSQVADVCVEALVCPAAVDKCVEVVAQRGAPQRSIAELFDAVRP